MYTWLESGKIYMDYGPIQMIVSAFRYKEPLSKELEEACQYASRQLQDLSNFLSIIKLPPGKINNEECLPVVIRKMVNAVKQCKEPTLTPMAAVAGTLADEVADFLVAQGATKVIANNGGDIALRLLENENVKVGIVSDINAKSYTHTITIDANSKIGGIATSGFGGRGFTKGIASAAVSFGSSSSEADATATLIGNYTYSDDPGIKQIKAEKLDPNTDLIGQTVTLSIDNIDPLTFDKALLNGKNKVKELVTAKIIQGAAIFANGKSIIHPPSLENKIFKL